MESKPGCLQTIPDDELLRRLGELVSQSRRVEAELVAHIDEVDERRLFARFAFPSMFAYCTHALHLSEAEAYRRITVARAVRRFPVLFEMLRNGRLHLSGAAMLAPVLTIENHGPLLARAVHLSKRQLEELVAELSPRPDVASSIRKLPARAQAVNEGVVMVPGRIAPGPADVARAASLDELVPGRVPLASGRASTSLSSGTPLLAASPSTPRDGVRVTPTPSPVRALSPGRYRVQFTASTELREKLERLAALMRSEVPDGDVGVLIERAITEKLERLEARRFAKMGATRQAMARPREAARRVPGARPVGVTPGVTARLPEIKPGLDQQLERTSRHIPASVRRAVYERDGERCRFVDENRHRCSERHGLEFHHRHPFGMGGGHSAENVSLLCRAHNRYLAEKDYGSAAIRAQASRPAG